METLDRLQQEGVIPAGVKFQISLPTPIAPTYNNMVPTDRPALIPVWTTHLLGEVAAIARALPNDRIALQWDVCQEVIAWEGYYEPGPVDFREETLAELIAIGEGVPAAIELGYHLCYGSPADEHVIQPKDAGIMVEIANAVAAGVRRSIAFFHLPVPQPRTDDAYFAPLVELKLRPDTELYLGLVHREDMTGNAAASPPPGAMPGSTASRPNAAWRAAIPSAFRGCSPRTCRPPNWERRDKGEEAATLTTTPRRKAASRR